MWTYVSVGNDAVRKCVTQDKKLPVLPRIVLSTRTSALHSKVLHGHGRGDVCSKLIDH